jgi:hypothetical protein
VLAARRPELSRPALRREICYELIRDLDETWVWRHHPGNLPVLPGSRADEDRAGLWEELSALTAPAALVRADWAGRLTATDLARLRRHAPDVEMITIPWCGEEILATDPVALATALNDLLATQAHEQ